PLSFRRSPASHDCPCSAGRAPRGHPPIGRAFPCGERCGVRQQARWIHERRAGSPHVRELAGERARAARPDPSGPALGGRGRGDRRGAVARDRRSGDSVLQGCQARFRDPLRDQPPAPLRGQHQPRGALGAQGPQGLLRRDSTDRDRSSELSVLNIRRLAGAPPPDILTDMASIRAAVIQMASTDDVTANLAGARSLLAEAASLGAQVAGLPENFAYLRREGSAIPCAQTLDGEIVSVLREAARGHRMWIIGGSFPERIAGDGRVWNTSVLLSDTGEIVAVYRKIHLFDVDLREAGGARYAESAAIAPGKEIVLAQTPFGPLGLSICYDLRFPELYRELASRGARWLAIPSAFTPHTGKDHWEVLLRARAIENQ